ncbi:MAG: tRNA (N(6)-L-threonylcarbamoyladenosine(37)-C(2))-methylthiotransferase MtaB [Pseudomonadota bacterium]
MTDRSKSISNADKTSVDRETEHTRVVTLGCRLNTFESEIIRQNMAVAGLDDAIVVNTCAVTAEAVRQAAQSIRKLRRSNPATKIVVTGCAAQIEPERFADMIEVDHVIGNAEKLKPETFASLAGPDAERIQVTDIMEVRETAEHLVDGFASRVRAYVQVQNGCDHRCTFCIIPYGRGPSRSVPAGTVVDQIARLVDNGHKEVVLTGVDITSYGPDLPGSPSLGRLVKQILKHVPGLERLRLSSLDQVEIDRDLLDAIGNEPRLMPHLHLSMQSGDDLTLKRMKRRHLRQDAIAFCRQAKELRPDVAFGADLIAGFPTETEEMFQRTLDIVDECELTYLHVFPFSPRIGTPAAKMPQVEKRIIKERAAKLRDKAAVRLTEYYSNQTGSIADVLMEQDSMGRTPQYAQVVCNATTARPGDVVRAQVTGHNGQQLLAEPLS